MKMTNLKSTEDGNLDKKSTWMKHIRNTPRSPGLDDDNYELSSRLYKSEERYKTKDYVQGLGQGNMQLYKECLWWQKRYGLNEKEIGEGIGEILSGNVDYSKEGLTPEEQKIVQTKLRKSFALPLDKLLDKIQHCD